MPPKSTTKKAATTAAAKNQPKKKRKNDDHVHPWIKSLNLLDPLLQFLTRRSGKTFVPLSMLQAVLPGGQDSPRNQLLLRHIPKLVDLGILRLSYPTVNSEKDTDKDQSLLSWDTAVEIGFPAPPMQQQLDENDDDNDWTGGFKRRKQPTQLLTAESLCGSTKLGGKRRLAALKKALKAQNDENAGSSQEEKASKTGDENKAVDGEDGGEANNPIHDNSNEDENGTRNLTKDWDFESHQGTVDEEKDDDDELCFEARVAREALQTMFQFEPRPPSSKESSTRTSRNAIPEYILPKQASYAGSHPAQTSKYADLSEEVRAKIPFAVLNAFGIDCGQQSGKINGRKLYSHQAMAIASALEDKHTLVCTSTGSGKSLVRFYIL